MDDSRHEENVITPEEAFQQPTPPSDSPAAGSAERHLAEQENAKRMDMDEDTSAAEMLSPMSAGPDKQEVVELPALPVDLGSPSLGYDLSNVRVCIPSLRIYRGSILI